MSPTSTAAPPPDPRIFHITHIDNLAGILGEGKVWCDAERIRRGLVSTNVGLKHIKNRRLTRPVMTSAGGMLGDYVPFNFCYRSVMLYSICRGHQDYTGGQDSIIHLVSRVSTATSLGLAWAFTDRHAELAHALHFDDLQHLGEVPWSVMNLEYWSEHREERQAEFLVHQHVPWTAVLGVAVRTAAMEARVTHLLGSQVHRPAVAFRPDWYYQGYP
jgi:hypothetical protein